MNKLGRTGTLSELPALLVRPDRMGSFEWMKFSHNIAALRLMAVIFAAIATLGFSVRTANADIIPISFTTIGTFSAGTPAGLTYTPVSFTGATTPDGTVTLTNLGQFSLGSSSGAENFTHDSFTLQFNFLTPLGVTGPVDFVGSLSGQINAKGNGNVHVAFKPQTEVISFSNQTSSGTFTLSVNDVIGLRQPGTLTATGSISNMTYHPIAISHPSATPEPGSFLLLGSALIALSWTVRRGFRR